MPGQAKSFNFGPFHLDLHQKVLLREGKPVSLAPKALMILSILVENHGRVVEREELMHRVWPGVFVEEGNLSVNIFALRKLLSVGGSESSVIETVPKRGYRFVVPVEEVAVAEREASAMAGQSEVLPLTQEDRRRDEAEIPPSKTRPVRVWVLGTALAAALAAGWLGWAYLAQPTPPRALHVVQLTHVGLASGVATDGARLYIAEEKGGITSIAQVPLEGGDPVPIPTPFRNVWLLDASPRRSELLVASAAARGDPRLVWTLPLVSGSPRRLGDLTAESAKWSPDATKIAFQGDDGILYVANADGSEVRKLADSGGGVDSWSPDGRSIRFTRTNQAKGGQSIWQVQSDGTQLQPFLPERQNPGARWGEGQSQGRWTPDGEYYLFREAFYPRIGIWAMPTKPGFWPFRRPEPTEVYAAAFDIAGFTIDPTGRRIFLAGGAETQELVRYDPNLRQFVPFLPGLPGAPIWSPDKQWIAFISPDHCLWKARPDGSNRMQLTFPPVQAFNLGWSPDGKRIAFHGLSPGHPGKTNLVSAEGGKIETLFADEPTGENCACWSQDGNAILFDRTWLDKSGNTTRTALFRWDMKTSRLTELPGSEDMACPSWSPDGQHLVAHSGDYHELRLFDSRSQSWRVVARGEFLHGPAWTGDSQWMFFQDTASGEDQPIYRVSVPDGKLEEVASRKQLLRGDVSRYRFIGLDPEDSPLAFVIHRNSDVYALDLSLEE